MVEKKFNLEHYDVLAIYVHTNIIVIKFHAVNVFTSRGRYSNMESKKAEEIMKSYGVISVSYNGMPVWIEALRGDVAEVTLIGLGKRMDIPISALSETDPIQTI